MGHTIIEKIIGKNIGREVKPGDIVYGKVSTKTKKACLSAF